MGIKDDLTNYGDDGFAEFLRTAFASSMGYSDEILSRPVVGITFTASDFNNCHRQVPELVEAVKHHVEEEEGEMLPKVEDSDMDLSEYGEQMAERKEELLAQMKPQAQGSRRKTTGGRKAKSTGRRRSGRAA